MPVPAPVVAGGAFAALPPLLADPPWRRRRQRASLVVAGLTAPEIPVTVAWEPGEHERWSSAQVNPVGAGDWERAAGRLRRGEPTGWRESVEFFDGAPEELARPLLADWRPEVTWPASNWMRRIAARFGVDVLPALLHLATVEPMVAVVLLRPFAAPGIPMLMAQWALGSKGVSPAAHAWLKRHPDVTARALMPHALGPESVLRRPAEHALFHLVAEGHGETLVTVGKEFGPEAAAAVESMVATDPMMILPANLPPIPRWVDPGTLPPVRLRAVPTEPAATEPAATEPAATEPAAAEPAAEPATAEPAATGPAAEPAPTVPAGAARDLAMIFALSSLDQPHPGVRVIRDACDPGDLARFAWGLFEAWTASGASGRQGWVLDALGLVGDDETVRRLAPRIAAWPGQSAHVRAINGVRVLAEIGTDVALMHLDSIAGRSRYDTLRTAAQRRITEVASVRGLTTEQLADRLVPDFGLAPDGSLTLDYGARRFVVGFDEELKPFVSDAAGKRLKTLPKPGARDDAERATVAYQRFAALRKDVRTVAADRIRDLERAMLTGRRWPEDEFRRYLAEHPLLRHVTRRLLWGRYTATGVLAGGFRVAEDGTFADVHDEVTTIAGGQVIGVVHPLHLGETLPLWSEIFADYQIMQPFPQLGREIAGLTEAEAAGVVLTRFEGRRVPFGAVLGLESRGWRREDPEGGGMQVNVTVSPVEGLEIVLSLDPGIVAAAAGFHPEQTLGPVGFRGRGPTWGDLDPVVVSEVIRDLERLDGGR
ncbi:DUF4132 domain-containing protein [Actinoplanes sp. NEAU-A12]|uniref:DUF4132 domain-containing protein n=1 Tax=Actinoplanes sandaracinus TaxID=3045177 RepID=A0ABT6WUZ7_9ACTN|nr:DUF4132 domain-containing protein [Actinoplanes sandaracinus]MDI6103519.1 DUF4132 domain-containing protein [Actinoplanes sandaracinus]